MRDRESQRAQQAEAEPPERFVAVHADVQEALRNWEKKAAGHRPVAKKVASLMEALVRNQEETVQALLRQLDRDPIRDSSGLVELGPKQSKGGAPRVFLLRDFSCAFFVAAGAEKGSSGVKIDVAKNRADEIRRLFGKAGKKSGTKEERSRATRQIAGPTGPYRIITMEVGR